MRNNLLLGMLLMMGVVSGCKVELEHEPEIIEFHRYEEGLPMAEIQINEGDKIYHYIKALLDEHRRGWHPSFANYAPCVKVRAHDDMYRLNICPNKLILMYWNPEKTHTTQVVKRVPSETYDEIVVLVEAALRGAEGSSGSEESNP